MSAPLIGDWCWNCRRNPPPATRWPIRYDHRWYCGRECLIGLHPELIHDAG